MTSSTPFRRALLRASVAPLAALSFLAGGLSAAASDSDESVQEVIVQATRGTKLDDLDISATVLSRQQVQQSPEPSIEQLLARIPGVVMPQLPAGELHPTGDPIELRGFGNTPGRTLIMVDGVPFNDPFFRYLDWQKIPKDQIDSVEVIRGGGATTLWGNMAMAGIINIVTRPPLPDEAHLSVGYGNYDTIRIDSSATLYSDQTWLIAGNFSHAQTEGFDKVPKWQRSPIFGGTSSYSNDGGAQIYFTPDADQKYYLKLDGHYMAEDGLQEAIASNAWGTYDAHFGGDVTLPDSGSIEVNGFFEQWHYATQNATDQCYDQDPTKVAASSKCPGNVASAAHASSYLGQIENAPYDTVGGSVLWKPSLPGGWPLSGGMVGIDGRTTSARDEITIYARATPGAVILAKPTVDIQGDHSFEGVFAQASYTPAEVPVLVTVGLREDFWQDDSGSVNGSSLPSRTYSHFDPRLGVKYDLPAHFYVRGAVYESFDAPGMNQTFRSFLSGTSLTLGNTGLIPETNFGGEGGVGYRADGLSVEVNGFTNSLDNFITSGKLCNSNAACAILSIPSAFGAAGGYSSITKNFNAGSAVIQGGEVIAGWHWNDRLSVEASWTRTAAEITDNSHLAQILGSAATANSTLPIDKQLGGVPAWTALLSVTWSPIERVALTASLRSWPSFWNGTAHVTSGLNSSATVVDLGASWRFLDHCQFFVDLQNVGNVTYLTSAANSGASLTSPSNIGTPFMVFSGLRADF